MLPRNKRRLGELEMITIDSSTQCKINIIIWLILCSYTDLGTDSEMTQNKSKQPSYFCSISLQKDR
jgi:hypothetical protein